MIVIVTIFSSFLFHLLRHIKIKVLGQPRTQDYHQTFNLHTFVQTFKPNFNFPLVELVGYILLRLLNSLAVRLHWHLFGCCTHSSALIPLLLHTSAIFAGGCPRKMWLHFLSNSLTDILFVGLLVSFSSVFRFRVLISNSSELQTHSIINWITVIWISFASFHFLPSCLILRFTLASFFPCLPLVLPFYLLFHPLLPSITFASVTLLFCRVWEVTTGEVLNTLIHHNEAVLHLRFANGLMVTCSKDRSIAVWDMASPTDISLRRVLVGHRAAVNVVDFDDKYIVSASGDRTIKVTEIHKHIKLL